MSGQSGHIWDVSTFMLQARYLGAHATEGAAISCRSLMLTAPDYNLKTGADGSGMYSLVEPAYIVAAGVDIGAIRAIRWLNDLTHLLFIDPLGGEQKEFHVGFADVDQQGTARFRLR